MEIFTTAAHREMLRRQISSAETDVFADIRTELAYEADICLTHPLYSVTFSESRAVSGNPHDYYSEGPYWWPDPKNPGGPFIRRDGEVYPGRLNRHEEEMIRLVNDVYLLSCAGYLLNRRECAARADELLRCWFLDEKTLMNPHLNYAQAIFGHTDGRGIGIIDTVHLIRLIAALEYFSMCDGSGQTLDGLRDWFAAYLHWMDTSKNGIEERDYKNNHAAWWNAQAASYAAFVGDDSMLGRCYERFTAVTLPSQQAEDGSFPLELARTKSLSYSMYVLDACAVTAEVAYRHGVDLWNRELENGRGMAKALDFILPYYMNPSLWQYRQITPYHGNPSVAFLLGALRISDKYAPAANRYCNSSGRFHAMTQLGAPCLLEKPM